MRAISFICWTIVVATMSGATTARANLGETPAQIKARWGDPIKWPRKSIYSGTEMIAYRRPGFPNDAIEVTYLNGTSQLERYYHFTSSKLDTRDDHAAMSENELHAILNANSAGRTWRPYSYQPIPESRKWLLGSDKTTDSPYGDLHTALAYLDANVFSDGRPGYPIVIYTHTMAVLTKFVEEGPSDPKPSETLFNSPRASTQSGKQNPAAPSANPSVVSYTVVKEWPLGKDIVIPVELRNEAGLIAVTRRLAEETKGADMMFIYIYDDAKAEKLLRGGDVPESQQDFVDRHYIGEYTRNRHSGIDELLIILNGAMGEQKRIKFNQ